MELAEISSFKERLEYLQLYSSIGIQTFGGARWLNQVFYKSPEWLRVRRDIILRDDGCDLGLVGYQIPDHILIHHINPITIEDVKNRNPIVFDPNNLICVSHNTHNAIHYGRTNEAWNAFTERSPGDTKLW